MLLHLRPIHLLLHARHCDRPRPFATTTTTGETSSLVNGPEDLAGHSPVHWLSSQSRIGCLEILLYTLPSRPSPKLGETCRLTANPACTIGFSQALALPYAWLSLCVTLISDPGSYDLIEARPLPCKCHLASLLRCPRVVPRPPPCCLWPRLVPYSPVVELSQELYLLWAGVCRAHRTTT